MAIYSNDKLMFRFQILYIKYVKYATYITKYRKRDLFQPFEIQICTDMFKYISYDISRFQVFKCYLSYAFGKQPTMLRYIKNTEINHFYYLLIGWSFQETQLWFVQNTDLFMKQTKLFSLWIICWTDSFKTIIYLDIQQVMFFNLKMILWSDYPIFHLKGLPEALCLLKWFSKQMMYNLCISRQRVILIYAINAFISIIIFLLFIFRKCNICFCHILMNKHKEVPKERKKERKYGVVVN